MSVSPNSQEKNFMPSIIQSDVDDLGVIIKFSGNVKGEEIFNLNLEIMSNPLFIKWRYQIWDFSEIEKFEVTNSDLRNFARQDGEAGKINPNQRIAIIRRKIRRSSTDAVFHIYQEVWGAYQSSTFSDIESARNWGLNG